MDVSRVIWKALNCTHPCKSINPFSDFSHKTVIFMPLEKYLKLSKNSFSKFVATFTNEGHVPLTFGAKIFTLSKDTTL